MNKNKLIALIFLAVVIIGGGGIWYYFSSIHKVSISLADGSSVNLFQIVDGNYKKVKTLSKSTAISLGKGNYCARPVDDKYSDKPECVIVDNKDAVLNISPDYSTDYLSTLLETEFVNIHAIIIAKYSPLIDNYSLAKGQLFKKGDWYGTTLSEVTGPSRLGDNYRIILKKINGIWTVAAKPQLVFSRYDYKDIPIEILSAVNTMI